MAESSNQADNGISKWTNSEVLEFLGKNDLQALASVFEENEVTGLDLLLLTEDEMRSMLKISKLQASKIKKLVDSDDALDDAEDTSNDTDFNAATVPPITDRDGDSSDDEEARADLKRAKTGVTVAAAAAAPATAAPAAGSAAPGAGTTTVVGTVIPVGRPLLPTGTGALQLDCNTVARYQQCVATISRLEAEGVAQSLPAARSRLKATQKRLALQEAKFAELRQEEEKHDKKLEKLVEGKWYPGKYILGKKRHEDKVSKKTEKLESVSNQVRAAGTQLEELNAEVTNLSKVVTDLQAKCVELDEARNFCASLLQSAFAGGAVGDAQENLMEAEVGALGPKIEEVRRYKTVYGNAYEHMRGAAGACHEAAQLLQSASGLATVDIATNFIRPMPMMNSPGGLMVDLIKRNQMRQGVQLCKVAGELALKSRDLVPDMPRVKAEKLKQLKVGFGLFDVVFDNMISDIIVARKIREMLNTLRSVMSDIDYAERWLHGWINGRIDQDMRALEATLATKRNELHQHRMQLLHRWIEARSQGAVQEAPPPVFGHPQQPFPPPQQPYMYPPQSQLPQQPPPGYPPLGGSGLFIV